MQPSIRLAIVPIALQIRFDVFQSSLEFVEVPLENFEIGSPHDDLISSQTVHGRQLS